MAQMTRKEVYDVIDSERAYQIDMARSDDRPDMIPQLSVAETILAMEHALAEARSRWYSGSMPHANSMDFIRKVTALGVQAGENHGMPRRKNY